MRHSMVGRFVLALTLIVTVSLSLTAYLNHFKFDQSFAALVQSRFAFVGREVEAAIEESMGVGLALHELRTTQDIIERMKQQDPDIRVIEVFDHQGQIIFSTDRASIGEWVTQEWLRTNRQAKPGEPWHWSDADGRAVGLAVINPLGLVEGGVVLTYTPAVLDSRVEIVGGRLARFAGEMLVLFVLLTLLGVVLVLNGLRQRLLQFEQALDETLDTAGRPLILPGGWHWERSLAEFEMTAREVMAELADAQGDIEALDRSAP